jgi:HEAT repeat protein
MLHQAELRPDSGGDLITSIKLPPGSLTKDISLQTGDRLEDLVRLLDKPDSFQAMLAAMRIRELGQKAARESVEHALLSATNAAHVSTYAGCLAEIGDARSVEPLLSILLSAEERADDAARNAPPARRMAQLRRIVWAAVGVIDGVGDEAEHARTVTRQLLAGVTMNALGVLGDKRAIEPIRQYVSDPDGWIRVRATEALQQLESA